MLFTVRTLCGRYVVLWDLQPGGSYTNHWAVTTQIVNGQIPTVRWPIKPAPEHGPRDVAMSRHDLRSACNLTFRKHNVKRSLRDSKVLHNMDTDRHLVMARILRYSLLPNADWKLLGPSVLYCTELYIQGGAEKR
jgi:hypothetical protein